MNKPAFKPAIGWYTLVDREGFLEGMPCNESLLATSITDEQGNIYIDRLTTSGGGYSGESHVIDTHEWAMFEPLMDFLEDGSRDVQDVWAQARKVEYFYN